jgi:beta-lactamase regulating signal transducer with metallopeptidase domain
MIAPDLNVISQVLAARIVDCLVGGTLIAIAASVLVRLARGLTSTARFAVWFSALVAIASLALVGGAGRSSIGAGSAAALHKTLVLPASWALYILGVWAAIASLFLARVAVGVVHLRRLRRSCVPLNPGFAESGLREALNTCGNSRRVALCTSQFVNVPTAVGLIEPAVVLPVWLINELSPAELRQLVLHELAHLRRWDDWTNLAQQIVKALVFFHPAVWWIEKRVSLEREMACDDAVVIETANPRAYAECLAHLAEKTMIRRGLALAQAAVGRLRQTSLRVARILRGDRPATTRYGWAAAATAVAGFAIVCNVAVSKAPRLIAFESDQPQIVAARYSPLPPLARGESFAKLPAVHPVLQGSANIRSHIKEAAARWRPATSRHQLSQTARLEATPRLQPDMVHPASLPDRSAGSAPAIQAVYVVIESREYLPSGVVLCRESVWRFAVMPTNNPSTRIPRKQT